MTVRRSGSLCAPCNRSGSCISARPSESRCPTLSSSARTGDDDRSTTRGRAFLLAAGRCPPSPRTTSTRSARCARGLVGIDWSATVAADDGHARAVAALTQPQDTDAAGPRTAAIHDLVGVAVEPGARTVRSRRCCSRWLARWTSAPGGSSRLVAYVFSSCSPTSRSSTGRAGCAEALRRTRGPPARALSLGRRDAACTRSSSPPGFSLGRSSEIRGSGNA